MSFSSFSVNLLLSAPPMRKTISQSASSGEVNSSSTSPDASRVPSRKTFPVALFFTKYGISLIFSAVEAIFSLYYPFFFSPMSETTVCIEPLPLPPVTVVT